MTDLAGGVDLRDGDFASMLGRVIDLRTGMRRFLHVLQGDGVCLFDGVGAALAVLEGDADKVAQENPIVFRMGFNDNGHDVLV